MMTYGMRANSRKELVKRVSELTGIPSRYQGMPTCAYQIGRYTVAKDGTLSVDDIAADTEMIGQLISEGLIEEDMENAVEEVTEETVADITAEETAEEAGETVEEGTEEEASEEEDADDAADTAPEASAEETAHGTEEATEGLETAGEAGGGIQPGQEAPASLDISYPMGRHTGTSLRNLLNLIYSRGSLISKAAGTDIGVDEDLIEALKDDSLTVSAESLMGAVADYEEQNGKGIRGLAMTPKELTFTGFAKADADHADAYTKLVAKMNEQALAQKRIQAKPVDDSNEKYSFYTWMTRIGMKGAEYKQARKILIENLDGHCAFKTQEEADRFSARMKAKREAEKAARLAVEGTAEQETAEG